MMESNIGRVLGRVSIVNYNSETVYDTFVYYPAPVVIRSTNYRYSGISLHDIKRKNGAQPFSKVQSHLIELLRNRVVIFHDIKGDKGVMGLDLTTGIHNILGPKKSPVPVAFEFEARDTLTYMGFRQYARPGLDSNRPSLKTLAQNLLGRQIKQGRVSSVEDAIATMGVYRLAEAGIDEEQGKQEGKRVSPVEVVVNEVQGEIEETRIPLVEAVVVPKNL